MAKTYVEYFADPKHREIYRRLLDEVELQKEVVTEDSQKFAGINFVITGSVESFCQSGRGKSGNREAWRKGNRQCDIKDRLSD